MNAAPSRATIFHRGSVFSGEFHTELAALTGNTVLCECLSGLVARSTLISALYESLGKSSCSFEDHEAIIEALDTGDAAKATELMAGHLRDVELKMLERPARGAVDLREVFAKPVERDKALGK